MGRKGCNQSPIALDSIGLTDGLANGSPAHSTDLGCVFLRVGVLLHAFLFASGIHTTRPLSSQNVLLLARTLNHLDRLVMPSDFLNYHSGHGTLAFWSHDHLSSRQKSMISWSRSEGRRDVVWPMRFILNLIGLIHEVLDREKGYRRIHKVLNREKGYWFWMQPRGCNSVDEPKWMQPLVCNSVDEEPE
ncbi:hypothetical protein F2Q68_00044528 [Brassica cretica]|uniref:Uncharacterized protein n=1 Tax=Brassica cretica TaxID=69181 RepID=A0A8S9LLY5_BRACR|nr:hypothetical protein F2Q68_00044528 [Brassica cretica]